MSSALTFIVRPWDILRYVNQLFRFHDKYNKYDNKYSSKISKNSTFCGSQNSKPKNTALGMLIFDFDIDIFWTIKAYEMLKPEGK